MYLNTRAIILNAHNYSNYDKIYKVFSLEEGKISVVGKGVRKIKSRRGSHLDTLNLVKLTLFKKDTFYYLSSSNLENSFSNIKNNLNTSGWAFYILEAISAFSLDEEPNEYVFNETIKVLNSLDNLPKKRYVYKFLKNLIQNQGYWNNDYYIQYPFLQLIESDYAVSLADQAKIDEFFSKKLEQISEKKFNSTLLLNNI